MTSNQRLQIGEPASRPAGGFVRSIVAEDLRTGARGGRVVTRFPPEPNGYLHIGHAKSTCLNFGVALENGGVCHLRFDDSNPTKEELEYVQSIQEDVRWLGWDWGDHLYYASDYFDQLYGYAVQLIKAGKAYVCSLSPQEIREYRGTLTEPGRNSPYRDRSVEENLGPLRRDAGGEIRRGRPCPAGENRHGISKFEHARPGHLPDPEGPSLPHG